MARLMSFQIGQQLGIYEITALAGKGGMGEVYRARDTRLGREVAIKILPREFTEDPNRLSRFEREARVLASLNHPNVGAIYGL
jgi:serine/threonine protein kinase